jgi:hypothetical protein
LDRFRLDLNFKSRDGMAFGADERLYCTVYNPKNVTVLDREDAVADRLILDGSQLTNCAFALAERPSQMDRECPLCCASRAQREVRKVPRNCIAGRVAFGGCHDPPRGSRDERRAAVVLNAKRGTEAKRQCLSRVKSAILTLVTSVLYTTPDISLHRMN